MRIARPAGLLLAVVAAVLWAVNMTVLQPLTEPIGPWSEILPGNNTYWARDLRFITIMAVALALVLAGRGERRWIASAVLLGGLWVAADLAVDRADPTGAGATVLLAAGGCAVLAITATLLVRAPRSAPASAGHREPPAVATGSGENTAAPASGGWSALTAAGNPRADVGRRRRALATAACVAGMLMFVAAGIESPTDREPELNPAAFATAVLLAALAITGALAAAPAPSRVRVWIAAVLGVAAAVGVALARAVPPGGERMVPELFLGAVLFTGLTLLAWDWPAGRPDWYRHLLAALAGLVGPTAMLLVAVLPMMIVQFGAPFTALAGNSPIHTADSDVLLSLGGLLAGLGMALLLAWPPALGQPPAPAGPEPDGPDGSRRASAERR